MMLKNVGGKLNKLKCIGAAGILSFLLFSTVSYSETTDYVFSEVEDSIFNMLVDNGYSIAGACGILGNIYVENSIFDPSLYGNDKNTYGLCQWSDLGNRRDYLFEWCAHNHYLPNSIEGQIKYAIYELQGGDFIATRINEYLKTVDNPEDAAMEFAVGFERCVGNTLKVENDAIYTGDIYPECVGLYYQSLALRKSSALRYFEGYSKTAEAEYKDIEVDTNEQHNRLSALDIILYTVLVLFALSVFIILMLFVISLIYDKSFRARCVKEFQKYINKFKKK